LTDCACDEVVESAELGGVEGLVRARLQSLPAEGEPKDTHAQPTEVQTWACTHPAEETAKTVFIGPVVMKAVRDGARIVLVEVAPEAWVASLPNQRYASGGGP
jgi:hypothetical protein